MPERVLEFASYQAMIACVAAGTGFAVVPKSVLEALRATRSIRQHPLPKRFSHTRTHLVWNGDPSPSLHGLLSAVTRRCAMIAADRLNIGAGRGDALPTALRFPQASGSNSAKSEALAQRAKALSHPY